MDYSWSDSSALYQLRYYREDEEKGKSAQAYLEYRLKGDKVMEDITEALVRVGWWRTSAIQLVKNGIAFTESRNNTHYILCYLPGHSHHVPLTSKTPSCLSSSPTWESEILI